MKFINKKHYEAWFFTSDIATARQPVNGVKSLLPLFERRPLSAYISFKHVYALCNCDYQFTVPERRVHLF